MNKRGWGAVFAILLSLTLLITACDPVPEAGLSREQKIEDMVWLFSRFEALYAPKDYKADRYKFDFEQLKTKYLEMAVATQTNEEFYLVMHRFAAEFGDAHTRLSFTPSPLPGRARMAFLGVSGERIGDGFLIKEILPTLDAKTYPLKVGDVITHVNGKPFLAYLEETIIPFRNLGNMESNYTALAGAAFTRSSLSFPIPQESSVEITYQTAPQKEHEPSTQKITLPWIIKDLQTFKQELLATKLKPKKAQSAFWFPIDSTEIALLDQNGNTLTFEDLAEITGARKSFDGSYKFLTISGWTANKKKAKDKKTGLDKLKEEGKLPSNAIYVTGSNFYPAYVTSQDAVDKSGNPTGGKKLLGYVRIYDFSAPDNSVAELEATLRKFSELGVSDLIIDTQSNPGGKLTLVMRIAQAFSNTKLKMPLQQYGLNYWWLDAIQMEAQKSSGPQKEMLQRLYTKLKTEADQGKRLSSPYSMEEIMPYDLKPNYDLKKDFKIVVLVNELNASCGDIFPQILQENKRALVMGKRTMGAGGNVANFVQAPNSHADLSQTLSLVVKTDGSYLENNGVTPDIIIDEKGVRFSEKSNGVFKSAVRYVLSYKTQNKCTDLLSLLK